MAEADNNGPLSNRRLSFIIIIIGMVFLAGYPIVSIATAQALAQNACNGTLTIYGRCESGTVSCTIPTGGLQCTTNVIFNPPFTGLASNAQIALTGTGTTTPNVQSEALAVINTNTTKWAVPLVQTEFRGDTSDRAWVRRPLDIGNLQTPTFFFVNVLTAASAGSIFILQCGTGISPSQWFNLTTVAVSTVGPKQGIVPTNPSAWQLCNNVLIGTLRVLTGGGDGITVGAFAQMEVVTARTVQELSQCAALNLTPTGFLFNGILTYPLPEPPQSITCAWKMVSETG